MIYLYMNCKFCKSYLGFNDNILCSDKDCIYLKHILEKIGVKKLVSLIKERLNGLKLEN